MKTLAVLLLLTCGVLADPATLFAASPKTVFVSILPQKYFVQQLCGNDFLDIEVMVQPGASPATYEPKSSQMRKLAGSVAYFAIGVPFEQAWLDRIAGVNPNMQIVHTDAGIEKYPMAEHPHHGKEEHPATGNGPNAASGHTTHHATSGLDPHIWLSPVLVKQQVQTIAEALIRLYPEQQTMIAHNLAAFNTRIDRLDSELRSLLADKKGMEIMVFHPSWGYFSRAYGLQQVAIEIEGKDPKPAQLRELIEQARNHHIRVVFAQPQFSTKSAELIAREIHGSVLFIDPLAEDWLANMQTVAKKFKEALD